MKAVVVSEYGGPEVMETRELPSPEPEDGQILVRVSAAGVNPVDTYIREGTHAATPDLPFTPGKDGSGVVEAKGGGVSKVDIGQRVYLAGSLSGTYAEFALCDQDHVWPLPDSVGFEEGAGVFIPYATAYRALFQKACAKSGETVFVHGASGAVGSAAVQWAKSAGMKVIGTAGSERGRSLVHENGADYVFDHSGLPALSYLDDISRETGGADIVLEMLANVNLQNDFRVLKKFGRIVVIGSRGSLEFTPRSAMTAEATILGMSLFNASAGDMEEIHTAIYNGLDDGSLRPFVGRRHPLDEAPAAHREVIGNKAYGKIILLP